MTLSRSAADKLGERLQLRALFDEGASDGPAVSREPRSPQQSPEERRDIGSQADLLAAKLVQLEEMADEIVREIHGVVSDEGRK